ncbi:MAG TPA: methyltransferase domain-containing protein [Mariprofundaceae bacterium]|nr:methyltransferase domain-containing protein [Mariprofundaceae bacterium]
MTEAPRTLSPRLEKFLASLPVSQFAETIAKRADTDPIMVGELLDTYINEARVSFNLVEKRLKMESPILEVGAGLCLLSLFLKREGYTVVALEPALGGFGLFETAKDVVLEHYNNIPLKILSCTAQELNPTQHGVFEFIFSNNVIEHIPDWQGALKSMQSVLSAEGSMRHACPNYTVPYEPHYGIPVFRHFQQLSRKFFLSPEADLEIWNSLNFITARQVKKFCWQNHMECDFDKEMLYRAFMRIHDDPMFKERHRGPIAFAARIAMNSPLRHLIRRIPAGLATPMIFSIKHAHENAERT